MKSVCQLGDAGVRRHGLPELESPESRSRRGTEPTSRSKLHDRWSLRKVLLSRLQTICSVFEEHFVYLEPASFYGSRKNELIRGATNDGQCPEKNGHPYNIDVPE